LITSHPFVKAGANEVAIDLQDLSITVVSYSAISIAAMPVYTEINLSLSPLVAVGTGLCNSFGFATCAKI
jgi:hypothetical protein